MKYHLVFDVGGTMLKAAVSTYDHFLLEETVAEFPSCSHETKERLVNHWVDTMERQIAKIRDEHILIVGIGFAFPGPFDYQDGVSYIQGQDKFESLYDINIREELYTEIFRRTDFLHYFAKEFPILFGNDARMFALGERAVGKARNSARSIFLTIGTGLGSCFMDHSHFVEVGEGIPKHGWLYALPFHGGIADDFISRRGLLKLAGESGFNIRQLDVVDIAALARQGNVQALEVFHRFGQWLAEFLERPMNLFRPQTVIVGGQISGSFDLFGSDLARRHKQVRFEATANALFSTLCGVSILIEKL